MESKNLRQGEGISKDATTSSVDVCIAGTSYAESTQQGQQPEGTAFF